MIWLFLAVFLITAIIFFPAGWAAKSLFDSAKTDSIMLNLRELAKQAAEYEEINNAKIMSVTNERN